MPKTVDARKRIDFVKPLRIKTYKFVEVRTGRSVQLDLSSLVKKATADSGDPVPLFHFRNKECLLPQKPQFEDGYPYYLYFRFSEVESWKLVFGLCGGAWLTIDHYHSFIQLTV